MDETRDVGGDLHSPCASVTVRVAVLHETKFHTAQFSHLLVMYYSKVRLIILREVRSGFERGYTTHPGKSQQHSTKPIISIRHKYDMLDDKDDWHQLALSALSFSHLEPH